MIAPNRRRGHALRYLRQEQITAACATAPQGWLSSLQFGVIVPGGSFRVIRWRMGRLYNRLSPVYYYITRESAPAAASSSSGSHWSAAASLPPIMSRRVGEAGAEKMCGDGSIVCEIPWRGRLHSRSYSTSISEGSAIGHVVEAANESERFICILWLIELFFDVSRLLLSIVVTRSSLKAARRRTKEADMGLRPPLTK